MLYLFDTNALSDYMAGHTRLLARVAGLTAVDEAVICTIVRGEIVFGIERLPMGRGGHILRAQPTPRFKDSVAWRSRRRPRTHTPR